MSQKSQKLEYILIKLYVGYIIVSDALGKVFPGLCRLSSFELSAKIFVKICWQTFYISNIDNFFQAMHWPMSVMTLLMLGYKLLLAKL